MAGGGEAAHVGADLGDDHLRGQVTDARDAPQQPDRLAEKVENAAHLRVGLGNGGIQGLNLAQVQAQQEAMPFGDAPLQGSTQPLGWRLDAALHQGEQPIGIALALDQRRQNGAAGHAHDLGQHRGQLEVGVLQRLLDTLNVAGLLTHELLAGAQQGAQVLRRLRARTKLGRIRPWASRSASQSASATSVLRPGTFFTWAALARNSVTSPSART